MTLRQATIDLFALSAIEIIDEFNDQVPHKLQLTYTIMQLRLCVPGSFVEW